MIMNVYELLLNSIIRTFQQIRELVEQFIMSEALINLQIFYLIFILGLIIFIIGTSINIYKRNEIWLRSNFKIKFNLFETALLMITGIPLLKQVRENLKANLSFMFIDEKSHENLSAILTAILVLLSSLNYLLIKDVGQLWYVKILLVAISIILPFYTLLMVIDLYRFFVNRHIPKLIDEFRSAFVRNKKVRQSLKECSAYINKNIGKIIADAADSTNTEEKLLFIRDKFKNIWFNMFVVLLVNYKENGGELIEQLYKLNTSMTTQINIEKKKNRRLIMYEVFAVGAALFSVPVVMMINELLIGENSGLADPAANLIISRVIIFSIVALVIIRVLRKS